MLRSSAPSRRSFLSGAAATTALPFLPGTAMAAPDPAFIAIPKAMWVNQVKIGQIKPVLDYAKAIGCKNVFYGIGVNDAATINGMKSGQPTAAFTAINTFQNNGGRFWLMTGDVSWVTTPTVLPTPVSTCNEVIKKNNARTGKTLLYGLHLDVEPWAANWGGGDPQAICGQLYTLYDTVKKARPANTQVSAFMTGQVATITQPGTGTSYLKLYADRLHEMAMAFYYNSLGSDANSTATARAILDDKSNWWFGQNTIKSTPNCPRSGSWADVAGITSASFQTSMGTLWTETAKPSKAKGLAFNNYSFSTCVDTTGQLQGMPLLVPSS